MHTKVQRWGNSLAVRIPKAFAQDMRLDESSEVEISLRDGDLVISPKPTASYSLEQLLKRITPENVHEEISTSPNVGVEAW